MLEPTLRGEIYAARKVRPCTGMRVGCGGMWWSRGRLNPKPCTVGGQPGDCATAGAGLRQCCPGHPPPPRSPAARRCTALQEREAAEREAAALRARQRQAARDRALDVRRRQMRHVLFTQPEEVQVGGERGGG